MPTVKEVNLIIDRDDQNQISLVSEVDVVSDNFFVFS